MNIFHLLLSPLHSFNIFLILNTDQSFLKFAAILLNLPLLLQLLRLNFQILGISLKINLIVMILSYLILLVSLPLMGDNNLILLLFKYDIFFLHKIPFFRYELVLLIIQDIFDRDFLEELLVEVALDDQSSELPLLQRLLEDVLLDGVYWYQPVDMHSFGLADSVAPVLGLFVHSWVPIRVVEDYAVSTCQVDTDTTASRWGDEAEDPFVKVESINKLLSVLSLDRSIKSDVNVSVKVQELLKDI